MVVTNPIACSFCLATAGNLLITGPDGKVTICDDCVEAAVDVVDREHAKKRARRRIAA